MTNMNDIAKAVDHASIQSDRWLFIAALVILGLGTVLVIRYLVQTIERMMADHASARESNQGLMRQIVSDQHATNEKLAVVLDRNTTALDENTQEIRRCRESRESE
jgi:hypothetical protein